MYNLPKEEFAARRKRVLERIGPDGVAVIFGEPERIRSNDTDFKYRAGSDVLYLSGFVEPGCVLVLAPGHTDGDFIMFVRGRNPEAETWTGRRQGTEGAVANFGADHAHDVETLWSELPNYLRARKTLYWSIAEDPEFDRSILKVIKELRATRRKAPEAPLEFADIRDIVHEMRLFKTPAELELMRHAAKITSEAHVLAMRTAKPGMMEYELQAVIEGHFLKNGAEGVAYNSIVGAGDNATILHYTENRDQMKASDVVLIDAGCEYHFYAADITRSFPVSGRFEGAAKDVYEAVLEAQIEGVASVRKGLAYDELQTKTVRRLTQAMIDLGALKGSLDQHIEEESFRAYYPHNVGHWLGIDVHDVGSYFGVDRAYRALEPGMVLTIEPGLYFPAHDTTIPEALRGIGVRIEDDVLVTEGDPEVLTAECPKSVADIETLMNS